MTNYQADILQLQAEVLRGVAKALDDLAKALDGGTSSPSSSAPDADDTLCLRNGQSTSCAERARKSKSASDIEQEEWDKLVDVAKGIGWKPKKEQERVRK